MVFARYTKSKKHKKLKNVDPSTKLQSQIPSDPRKLKKKALKEALRIQRLSEQPMSKKLIRLIEFQDQKPIVKPRNKKSSQSLLKVVTNSNEGDEVGAIRPLKAIPKTLKQGPYESQSSFLRRLDKLCEKVRSEAKIEAKFNLGDEIEKAETKETNKLLRRRERDKKRKAKGKKNRDDGDSKFVTNGSNIFLPA